MERTLRVGVRIGRHPVKFARRLYLGRRSIYGTDPYATHVPVLAGLARLMIVRRVLELGCGPFSTTTFLDRTAFPHLTSIDSYETSPDWVNWVRRIPGVGDDRRLHVHLADGEMARAVRRIDFDAYDLVLVDDSTDMASRCRTIREVVKRAAPNAVIAIHDFEIREYRRSARGPHHSYAFTALVPHTGVLSQGVLSRRQLRALARLISRGAPLVDESDVAGWIAHFGDSGLAPLEVKGH
jgi:predicted O-methyltransferase YrrM